MSGPLPVGGDDKLSDTGMYGLGRGVEGNLYADITDNLWSIGRADFFFSGAAAARNQCCCQMVTTMVNFLASLS